MSYNELMSKGQKHLAKDAVGNQLSIRVPLVSPRKTIGEIKLLLPELAQQSDSINYIYVIKPKNRLIGVISVKELARHADNTEIKKVMVKDLVVSHPQVKKNRVAHLAIKHNIKAVPIVDDKNHFLGVLSSDKILAILYHEYRQYTYRHAGIMDLPDSFKTILDKPLIQVFLSRISWIVIGLIGGVFAAQIIEQFESILAAKLALASFIPLIVYISGAVGGQTQTFLIRDIAFNPDLSVAKYVFKQFFITGLIGMVCGLLVLGLVTIFWQSVFLGLVIGLATFSAISSSTIIAVFVPYILFKFKQDPASGSGPFATIIQDLLSIYIYFAIASALI
jgi:magnesium transporter